VNITLHVTRQYALSAYLSDNPYTFSSFQPLGSSYVSWGLQSLSDDNVNKHLKLSSLRNIAMFETCHSIMSGRLLAERSSCDKPSPYHSTSFEDSNNVVSPHRCSPRLQLSWTDEWEHVRIAASYNIARHPRTLPPLLHAR